MIREVCYALAITLLSGCSAICPKQPTTFVVAQVPPPPIIQRPQLRAWEITQDTPDGVVGANPARLTKKRKPLRV